MPLDGSLILSNVRGPTLSTDRLRTVQSARAVSRGKAFGRATKTVSPFHQLSGAATSTAVSAISTESCASASISRRTRTA